MSLNIFAEIARTNAAYCAAHGLSAAEAYGIPPNAAEFETSHLIDMGVPAEAAVPRIVEKYRTGFGGDIVAMTLHNLRTARQVRLLRSKYRNYSSTPFGRLAVIERRAKGQA